MEMSSNNIKNVSLQKSIKSSQEWLTSRWRVDSIRGVAILLLVFVHTCVDFSNYNDQELKVLLGINDILSDIRMPLFSFISGLIFGYNLNRSKSWAFVEKKAQRLLVPFVVVTAIILGLKAIYPNTSVPTPISDFPYYLVYGYSHLWFLQAIFIIFLFFFAFHTLLGIHSANYSILFLSSLAAFLSPLTEIQVFSVGKAFYLMPFFTLGLLTTNHIKWLSQRRKVLVAILAFCFGISLTNSVCSNLTEVQGSAVNSLIVGASFLLLIYFLMPVITPLYTIGVFSFTIFLFHSIFISLGLRVFPANPALGIPLTLCLAVLAPISIELAIGRFAPALRFSLGKGFN